MLSAKQHEPTPSSASATMHLLAGTLAFISAKNHDPWIGSSCTDGCSLTTAVTHIHHDTVVDIVILCGWTLPTMTRVPIVTTGISPFSGAPWPKLNRHTLYERIHTGWSGQSEQASCPPQAARQQPVMERIHTGWSGQSEPASCPPQAARQQPVMELQ